MEERARVRFRTTVPPDKPPARRAPAPTPSRGCALARSVTQEGARPSRKRQEHPGKLQNEKGVYKMAPSPPPFLSEFVHFHDISLHLVSRLSSSLYFL